MKAFNRILTAVLAAILLLFAVANGLLFREQPDSGRPYLVEISRLTRMIEEEGLKGVDLTACDYVTAVKPFGEDFYDSHSDYAIREIEGELYRFDYTVGNGTEREKQILTVNLVLMIMAALILVGIFWTPYDPNAMAVGGLGKFLDIQHGEGGVGDGFTEHSLGVGTEGSVKFFFGGIGAGIEDVLPDGAHKKEHILLDDADVFVDAFLGHVPDVLTVNADGAAGNVIKPGDKLT